MIKVIGLMLIHHTIMDRNMLNQDMLDGTDIGIEYRAQTVL